LLEEAGSGVTASHASRGCAFGDFDNDGDMDILVMNMNEPPSLLRNDVSGNQQTDDTEDKLTTSRWHLQAGLFANEVFYANAGIEAGIKPIHLLFSVGSNFHVTTWHLGLGTGGYRWGRYFFYQFTAGYSPLRTTIGIDSGQHKIKKLAGLKTGEGQWRVRWRDYRLRYDIFGSEVVLHSFRHRKDAY